MEVAAGGPIGSELSEPATESSEVIGIAAAVLILSVAFGTIVAMGMPIATAVVGLVVGLAGIGLLGHVATVPSIAPTLATMIGLGVGIDYALFLVSRHRAHLHEGMGLHESVALTVATSGSAIVYAGGTVVIALLALDRRRHPARHLTRVRLGGRGRDSGARGHHASCRPSCRWSGRGSRRSGFRASCARSRRPPARDFWAGWARFVTGHPALTAFAAARAARAAPHPVSVAPVRPDGRRRRRRSRPPRGRPTT